MDGLTLERLERLHGAACGMPFDIISELCRAYTADDELPFHEIEGSRAREAFGSSAFDAAMDFSDEELLAAFSEDCYGWVYGFESKLCSRPSTTRSNRACADGHLNAPCCEHSNGKLGSKAHSSNKSKGHPCFGYGDTKHNGVGRSNAKVANEHKQPPRFGFGIADHAHSSLKDLHPISILEMEMGETHHGFVLFGTITNPPQDLKGMLRMSIEDQFGKHVHASMHIVQDDPAYAINLKKSYTVGKYIAIKNPFLQSSSNDIDPIILVWDLQDSIEIVEQLPKMNPTSLFTDAQMHGDSERWDLALQCLTKCIGIAKSEKMAADKPKVKGYEASNMLVEFHSTRAKVYYYTNCFEEALIECDEALKIDPYHCKSLYRKGLALEGLFRFEEACVCLENAAKRNRGDGKTKRKNKIRAILRSCRNCCGDNQKGKFADLARYLLHVYKPGENGPKHPSFFDYVGHVEVKLLGRGKGRGMFASRDVKAGDVLVVSNAMAICYQSEGTGENVSAFESERKNLVRKVKSMKNLHRALSFLVGSGSTNASCTSQLAARAEACLSPFNAAHDEMMHVDKAHIKEIVRLNAFGPHHFCRLLARHGYASKYVDARAYLGLWFLPSFINHSCLANASRLVVGEAMFVHAARDINAGEEITLPYFDTLMPLKHRNDAMKRWEFSCRCKRCTFEQTFQTPLSNVIKHFDCVYASIIETVEKAIAAESLRGFDKGCFNLPMRSEYEKVKSELAEVMVATPESLLDNEKSDWMMASYAGLLWFQALQAIHSDKFPNPGDMLLLRSLLEAMQRTAPGQIRSLVVIGNVNASLQRGFLDGPAFAICKSVFGAQEPHVLAELVRLYASFVPFP